MNPIGVSTRPPLAPTHLTAARSSRICLPLAPDAPDNCSCRPLQRTLSRRPLLFPSLIFFLHCWLLLRFRFEIRKSTTVMETLKLRQKWFDCWKTRCDVAPINLLIFSINLPPLLTFNFKICTRKVITYGLDLDDPTRPSKL